MCAYNYHQNLFSFFIFTWKITNEFLVVSNALFLPSLYLFVFDHIHSDEKNLSWIIDFVIIVDLYILKSNVKYEWEIDPHNKRKKE